MNSHLVEDLGMKSTIGDPALYTKVDSKERILGISGYYVNDSLNAGRVDFQYLTEKTFEMFESKPRVYDSFDVFGSQIRTKPTGTFEVTQQYYIGNLSHLESGTSFDDFRKHRALLSWITYTRLDLQCRCNKLAQVTERTFLGRREGAQHWYQPCKGANQTGTLVRGVEWPEDTHSLLCGRILRVEQ